MKRKVLINRKIWLVLLLLFFSVGMQAEDYELWIGSLQVTSDNASAIHLAGDDYISVEEDGSVSFDASSSTLTLNNAHLQHGIISGLATLTIRFMGTNQVNTDGQVNWMSTAQAAQNNAVSVTEGNENATLVFEKAGEGSVQLCGNTMFTHYSAIAGFASVSYGSGEHQCYLHTSYPSKYHAASKQLVEVDGGSANPNATISSAVAYPLWIGNGSCLQVTEENQDEITSEYNIEGEVSFVPTNNTLKMKNATISTKIYSNLGNLKIDVEGNCFIQSGDTGSVVRSVNAGTLTISKTSENASLTMESDSEWGGMPVVQGFQALDYATAGFNLATTTNAVYGEYTLAEYEDYVEKIYGLYNPDETEAYNKGITSATFTTAQLYPLWVAGVRVTEDNAVNVLGNEDTPQVVFDASTNTLTLNGAEIDMSEKEGYPVESSIENLIVHLKGYNMITLNSDAPNAFHFTNDTHAGNLTFTAEASAETFEYGMLQVNGIYQYENFTFGYTVSNTFQEEEETGWHKTEYGSYNSSSKFVIIQYIEYYPLWQGDAHLSSSNTSPESGGTRYNPTIHTLHLDFYGYGSNEIKSGLDELIVELCGESSVRNFTYTGEGQGRIIFRSDAESMYPSTVYIDSESGAITGFSEVVVEAPLRVTTPSTVPSEWDANTTTAVITNSCFLRIAGIDVTESNKSDIFDDGTVSFNTASNTLTLNNAQIVTEGEMAGIDYLGTSDLTISLIGNNKIQNSYVETIRYNADESHSPSLTFAKGDNLPCSLELQSMGMESEVEYTVISTGFKEINGVNNIGGSTGNSLTLVTDQQVSYGSQDNGLYYSSDAEVVPVSSAQIVSVIDLTVEGLAVTAANAEAIKEGVSFNLETNTLTLNNATISNDANGASIRTGLDELIVNIIGGDNDLYGSIVAKDEKCKVTFKSSEENRATASINFWWNVDPQVSGFGEGNIVYDDGLCLRQSYYNQSYSKVIALFIPRVTTTEPDHGLYFTDYEFTLTQADEAEGFDIYWADMLNGTDATKYEGPFTLPVGSHVVRGYAIYPGQDTEPARNYYCAAEFCPKVIEKPTFSVASGTYDDHFTVYLQNIPEQNTSEVYDDEWNEVPVPQVWYYFGDNKNDSVRYDAEAGIPVTESQRLSVYIIDGDSGKVVKSDTVMAEYTIPYLGITIQDVMLAKANQDYFFGDGTASYDPETKTLTLENLAIECNDFAISSSVGSLTVLLKGYNYIWTNTYAIRSTVTTNVSNLTFTTDEDNPGQLQLSCYDNSYNFASNMFPMFKVSYENGLKRYEETLEGEKTGDYIVGIPPLVYQKPEFTVRNEGCFFTDQTVELSVKTNSDKFDIYYAVGDGAATKYEAPFSLPAGKHTLTAYTVKKDADANAEERSEETVQQVSVYERPSFTPASGFYVEAQEVAIENLPDSPAQVYYYIGNDKDNAQPYAQPIDVAENTTLTAYIVEAAQGREMMTDTVMAVYRMAASYDVWVQSATGVVSGVNEANKDDVLGDGKVSYDSGSHTLTLNGATLAGITSQQTDRFTILLKGVNTITNGIHLEKNTSGTLHFSAANDGMLELSATGSVVSGFAEITYGDDLTLLTPGQAVYKNGAYLYTRNDDPVLQATIAAVTPYQLWVAGTQVTSSNKDDVLGDGKVNYDADSRLLVLNGARIGAGNVDQQHGGIECYDEEDNTLTIQLGGKNIVSATETACIYSPTFSKELHLTFKSQNEAEASLVMTTYNDIDAVFHNVNEEISYENTELTEWSPIKATILSSVKYQLWIGDKQVSSLNRQNVLGDKKASVSFDGQKTLLLNDAQLTDKPIRSELTELHIILQGESQLTSNSSEAPIQGAGQSLVFNTSPSDYGSLRLVKNGEGNFLSGLHVLYQNDLTSAIENDVMTIWRNVPITPIVDEDDEGIYEEAPVAVVEFSNSSFMTTNEETGNEEPLDLSNATIENLLYTLPEVEDGGNIVKSGEYEKEQKDEDDNVIEPAGIVLTVSLSDEEANRAVGETPGTDEYAEVFKGITLMAPAGIGVINIIAKVSAGAKLNVKVGDQPPLSFPNEEYPVVDYDHVISIPYESAEPVYVRVYHGGETVDSRSKTFREKVEKIHVKVTGLQATASSLIQVNAPGIDMNGPVDQVKMYELSNDNFMNGGIVISNVCGKPVTSLSSGLFDGVADKSSVDYIDLSGSAVQNLFSANTSRKMRARRRAPESESSRLNGLLNGYDGHTLVFLPAGNDGATESNIVVDGVCNDLALIDNLPFNTPYDFKARKVSFDRVFTAGQTATLFLPCTIPAAQAAKMGDFYRFERIQGSKAVFSEAETGDILANTPFIFVPSASDALPDMVKVPVAKLPGDATSAESANMVGTFKRIDWNVDMGDVYCFAAQDEDSEEVVAGQFVRMASGSWVPPYRAYLKAPSSPSRLQVAVGGSQEDATGISEVTERNNYRQMQDNKIYNMSGQRVTRPTKGSLYIINGRKEVFK